MAFETGRLVKEAKLGTEFLQAKLGTEFPRLKMNALEIIQNAAIKLGLDKPGTIEDTSDGNTQRLVGQLNSILGELVVDYDWQNLTRQKIFITSYKDRRTDNGVSGYPTSWVASDFGCFITHYLYNMTTRKIINEITLDRYELNQFYTTSPYSREQSSGEQSSGEQSSKFIFINDMICFSPEIPDEQQISFFYKSKYAVVKEGGRVESFSKDLETSAIDSTLLMLGTIWKYKDEMGFDYAESYRSYERYLNKLKDQDALRTIVDGNRYSSRHPFVNIPDTGYGEGA